METTDDRYVHSLSFSSMVKQGHGDHSAVSPTGPKLAAQGSFEFRQPSLLSLSPAGVLFSDGQLQLNSFPASNCYPNNGSSRRVSSASSISNNRISSRNTSGSDKRKSPKGNSRGRRSMDLRSEGFFGSIFSACFLLGMPCVMPKSL